MTAPSITHHPDKADAGGTFDLIVDDTRRGYLAYTLPDAETINVDYVEVSPALRGKGMGDKLVGAAVAWARKQKRQIVPHCSYARAVMSRTAKYQDVLRK